MSYDIFFQGFIAGESSGRGGAQMRKVVAPHVITRSGSFLQVRFGDGVADLYLSDDGMVANHASGHDPWQLLVAGAQAADWVILPMDRPVCLTGAGQREALPEELGGDVVVVESGDELLKVISGA